MVDERAFLGTGWAFPISLDAIGDVALVSREEDIRQAVVLILETELGERAMRPSFGAGLRALVFEPMISIASAAGPMKVKPASVTARANSAFSARNP